MEAPVYHLDKVVKAKQEDLEDFDGPLDLILHLLSKNKIEIRDISISDLLDQYLAWMAQREKLNLRWPASLSPWPPISSTSRPGCCCPSTMRWP